MPIFIIILIWIWGAIGGFDWILDINEWITSEVDKLIKSTEHIDDIIRSIELSEINSNQLKENEIINNDHNMSVIVTNNEKEGRHGI